MKHSALLLLLLSSVSLAFDITPYDINADGELTIDDLRAMDEPMLETLFEMGDASRMPAEDIEPGVRVEYQGLPIAQPANDDTNALFELLWGGKTFYRGEDGQMRLDNKILPDLAELLGLELDLARAEVTFNDSIEDGAPVVLIDYRNSEIPLFRSVRDEIRMVSAENDLYIGRASVYIFPRWRPLSHFRSTFLISFVNGITNNGYDCKADNGGRFPVRDYCFGLWFALQKK